MKRNYDPPHSLPAPLMHLRRAIQWLRPSLSPDSEGYTRGQGFVEFALILPVLLLVLLGIIEFGYVFAAYSGMFNAAREGTRYGVVNPRDVSGIVGHAREKVFLADQAAVDIAVRYDNGPDTSEFTDPAQVQIGDRVLVYLTHDLPTITPVIQPIMPTLPIRTEAARTVVSLGEGAWNPTGGGGDDEDEEEEGNAAIALSVTADAQVVQSGDAVGFTYVVTNTGDVDLSNVTVVDDFGNCFTIADLAVGATEMWSFSENIATTTTDHVTAAGADPQGGTASAADSVTVTVIEPVLDLKVVAQPWTVYPGELVNFTYVITNTGDTELTDVVVSDGLGTSTTSANVGAGASVFWEVSYRLYETTINNATATGVDPAGDAVSDSDSALVQVVSDLDPIVIHEPLLEGSAMVTGTAHAGRTVYIRDLMSGDFPAPASDNTGTQVDSSFEFTGLPPLVAGHVIVVEAYGEWDSAVVGGDFDPIVIGRLCHGSVVVTGTAEPDQTVTLHVLETGYQDSTTVDASGGFTFTLPAELPLQVEQTVAVSGYDQSASDTVAECNPNEAYLAISPQCGPSGPMTITVNGYIWDYQNVNDDITLRWDGDGVDTISAAPSEDWKTQITVDVSAGAHQVSAVNRIFPSPGITATFSSPCPAPDLVVTDMSLLTPAPLATYQPLAFRVAVENQGTRPVNNLFWVDLYASQPSPQATGIAWAAVSGLGVGDSTTLTITVQNGFEMTGTYTIWASADSWDQVSETDETNNDSSPIAVEITQEGEPPPPPPAGSGTIVGETWVSMTGIPVPHGRTDVRCLDGEGQVIASTTSDDTAKYALSDLPAGTYTVIGETWIDGIRYSRTLDGVGVNDNDTTVLLIILYRD